MDIDFAMAYDVKHGDTMKSEHWQSGSIQMHTMVSYHDWDREFALNVDPAKHPSRRMEVNYFMSDDKHHDAFCAAENIERKLDDWAEEEPEELVIISDGGPNHYKCRQNWHNLSRLVAKFSQDNRPLKLHQSVRGDHHGKGLVDGFNGTGKGNLRRVEKRKNHDETNMETAHIDNICCRFCEGR